MSDKSVYYLERVAAIIAALILLQTLYYKFTAHPESVYIFKKIGGEPYLRIGSGVVELLIGILLLFRKTSHIGALLGVFLMLGAIGQHVFVLGINVNNDRGTLFGLAVTTFICCTLILVVKRDSLHRIFRKGG